MGSMAAPKRVMDAGAAYLPPEWLVPSMKSLEKNAGWHGRHEFRLRAATFDFSRLALQLHQLAMQLCQLVFQLSAPAILSPVLASQMLQCLAVLQKRKTSRMTAKKRKRRDSSPALVASSVVRLDLCVASPAVLQFIDGGFACEGVARIQVSWTEVALCEEDWLLARRQ